MRARYLIATFLAVETLIFCSNLTPVAAQSSVSVSATAQTLCGDGIVQPPEQCDGANLNGASCSSLGHSGGTLSCSSNCVFAVDQCTSPSGGGNGNGSGGVIGGAPFSMPYLQTSVIFSGRAHAGTTVVISEGSTIRTSVNADTEGRFRTTLGATPGRHVFSVYGIDQHGRRFSSQTFSVMVNANIVTSVSGILLSSDIDLSQPLAQKSDLNTDSRVDIADMSILLYWWNAPDASGASVADLNNDGKVELTDLSILLFYWTG